MLIDTKKLDLYLKLNYNVLFAGRPGVGKTSIIYEAAKKAGLNIKYFSAPTMDPWVDLVGVPKNIMLTLPNGTQTEVLDLIPPKDFIVNKYDIIFIDEFNRAPPKVTNALMELMQFKTINGRSLDIKMVWAAINPFTEEGDFHVEKLDPAVEDRFHIRVDLPYTIDKDYIKKKHGVVGDIFIEWWKDQPEDVQFKVSPRRIDDSISFYQSGGDLKDMIRHGNVTDLYAKLKKVADLLNLENAIKENNEVVLKRILSRNLSKSMEEAVKVEKTFEIVFPFLPEEWISSKILNHKKDDFIFKKVTELSKAGNVQASSILNEICKTNLNSHFVLSNFSNIKHAMDESTLQKIEKNKENYEIESSKFLKSDYLLNKNQYDANMMALFIPDINSKSYFQSSALNNFYSFQKFKVIFEKFFEINTGNSEANLTKKDLQENFKDKLAFCIAVSCLMSNAMGSSGSLHNRVQSILRDSTSMSYAFTKSAAKNDFEDMESRIQSFEEKIKKVIPNELNTDDLIKLFNYTVNKRVRNAMLDPFTSLPKKANASRGK